MGLVLKNGRSQTPIFEPTSGVCSEVVGGGDFGVEFSLVVCSLDTPRPRIDSIDPSVQHQLDLLLTQIASLASAVSALSPGGVGGNAPSSSNAPSKRGAAITPPRSGKGLKSTAKGLMGLDPPSDSSSSSASSSSAEGSNKDKREKGSDSSSSAGVRLRLSIRRRRNL